jgi:hypothetical protein
VKADMLCQYGLGTHVFKGDQICRSLQLQGRCRFGMTLAAMNEHCWCAEFEFLCPEIRDDRYGIRATATILSDFTT